MHATVHKRVYAVNSPHWTPISRLAWSALGHPSPASFVLYWGGRIPLFKPTFSCLRCTNSAFSWCKVCSKSLVASPTAVLSTFSITDVNWVSNPSHSSIMVPGALRKHYPKLMNRFLFSRQDEVYNWQRWWSGGGGGGGYADVTHVLWSTPTECGRSSGSKEVELCEATNLSESQQRSRAIKDHFRTETSLLTETGLQRKRVHNEPRTHLRDVFTFWYVMLNYKTWTFSLTTVFNLWSEAVLQFLRLASTLFSLRS